ARSVSFSVLSFAYCAFSTYRSFCFMFMFPPTTVLSTFPYTTLFRSYTVPAHGGGRERALAIFTRSVPPRLARVSDRTSDVAVYRLAGPGALAVAVAAGLEVPPTAGHVLPRPDGGETARATEGAPFVLQVTVPAAAAALLAARLEAAGAVAAGPATLELSRILAGWPRGCGSAP